MQCNYARNYFDFHGKRYGVGTVVQLKFEGCSDRMAFQRCNGVAVFVGGLTSGYLRFNGVVSSEEDRCRLIILDKPERKIEKIIQPVYYEYTPVWKTAFENYKKTSKNCRADIMPGTILYIFTLLVTAIFEGAILLWVMITIVYLVHLINIYRD